VPGAGDDHQLVAAVAEAAPGWVDWGLDAVAARRAITWVVGLVEAGVRDGDAPPSRSRSR
jgi:hypothetical protein